MEKFQKQNIRYNGQVESKKINTTNDEVNLLLNKLKEEYHIFQSKEKDLNKVIEKRQYLIKELYNMIDSYNEVLNYTTINKSGGA